MNDDTRFWVVVFVLSTVGQSGLLDLLLLVWHGPDATISAVVREWCQGVPALPYVLAFGAGAFVYHVAYM